MITTYTYETSKGTNVETFSSTGHVTLVQNGVFKYEHHFGSHALNLQEQLLVKELETRGIKYTKN
jgi:thiamine pyrophosphokinase